MGSFVFRWDHEASEVYVTGTFDDWAKSVKLDKDADGFSKSVDLPSADKKIYYKACAMFVVDGNWTTDHTAPQEQDGANNVNNVLTPERISKPSTKAGSAFISGITPESTTAALAGQVPKTSTRDGQTAGEEPSDLPGSFPETPANENTGFSVNPIPQTSGIGNPVKLAPGEKVPDPSTLTTNTISSTAKDDPSLKQQDEESQTYGVNPLPATSGTSNPIQLKPGEKVPDPSTFTSNTIDSQVTTDKNSYEKGSGAPQLPNVVTPESEREKKGGMFSVPPVSGTMIPESSLPMGEGAPAEKDPGVFIQSAGAGTTTAALAGNVPKEPRAEATPAPEGQTESTNPQPAGVPTIQSAGAGTTTAALAGSVPKESERHDQSTDETNKGTAIAPTVPDVVQESINESHTSPEAAGSKAMVGEKAAVEQELLQEVKPTDVAGEPAPTASAALTESAPAPTSPTTEAHKSAMGAKSFTKPSQPAQPATTTTTATNDTTPATADTTADVPPKSSAIDSRDVSPMTKTDNQTQPLVTTGVGSSKAPETSTPAKPANAQSPAAEKKSKRVSGFFGKLFGKKDKDKK
ncbi:MAG: hypothetical protein Q9214_001210 [Letrouitia sp. 1 TL-2023]